MFNSYFFILIIDMTLLLLFVLGVIPSKRITQVPNLLSKIDEIPQSRDNVNEDDLIIYPATPVDMGLFDPFDPIISDGNDNTKDTLIAPIVGDTEKADLDPKAPVKSLDCGENVRTLSLVDASLHHTVYPDDKGNEVTEDPELLQKKLKYDPSRKSIFENSKIEIKEVGGSMTAIHKLWCKEMKMKIVHGQTLFLHPDQFYLPKSRLQSVNYRYVQSSESLDMIQLEIQMKSGWSNTNLATGVPALNIDGSVMRNKEGKLMFCLPDGNHRGSIQLKKFQRGETDMPKIGIRIIMYFGWDMLNPEDRQILWKLGAVKNEDSQYRCKETYGDIINSIIETRALQYKIKGEKISNNDVAAAMGRAVNSIHWLFVVVDIMPEVCPIIIEDCQEHGSVSMLNKRAVLELKKEQKVIMKDLPPNVQKEIFEWIREKKLESIKLTAVMAARNAYIQCANRQEAAVKSVQENIKERDKEGFIERLKVLIPNILSVVSGSARAGGVPSQFHPEMTVEEMVKWLMPKKKKIDSNSGSSLNTNSISMFTLVNESVFLFL